MKTIQVLTNTGKIIETTVVHDSKTYLTIIGFNSDYKYCVCLNAAPHYKAIARLNNKRQAIVFCNYLSKKAKLNHKAIEYNNRYYIVKVLKDIIINYLLDKKIYNSAIGNTKLSEI